MVATYFRLPEDELQLYRQMASWRKQSLADYIRMTLKEYSQQVAIQGKATKKTLSKISVQEEPLAKMKPFKSGISDGSINHDKYLY